MHFSPQQIWQAAHRQLLFISAELPIAETKVDVLLEALPLRLPAESYVDWFKRGHKMARLIPFQKMQFRFLTDIQRLAADTREFDDELPEIPLVSSNQQFRLKVDPLPNNRLKLTLEALGLASSQYANRLVGIAGANSKDQLISLIRLNIDGDGFDETLENTSAVRQALLRPVIALIEQTDA